MILSELPELKEVFKRLRSGRHVSGEDGAIYRALNEHEEEFRVLFDSLGFELLRHRRDFFYFKGSSGYSSFGTRIAVFFFILVESIAERGERLEETLFTQSFLIADLPHFQRERYRKYMAEAGMEDEDSLHNLFQRMERLGFLRREDEHSLRFRTPAYRLLDLCTEVLGESGEEPS